MEEIRFVPERFSELRRIRNDEEFEKLLKWKEKLLHNVSCIWAELQCVIHSRPGNWSAETRIWTIVFRVPILYTYLF